MLSFRFTLSLLAALAITTPVLAQTAPALPVTQEDGRLVLKAQGHDLALPMPDWIDAAAPNWAELVSPRFSQIGGQSHLEIYPLGEGEAFWTRLYGARISELPQPVLAEFRAVVMDVYAQTCRPEAIAFFQLEADDGDTLPPLGFVCGAYLDPATADEGEVTLMAFYKTDTGVAMLYEGWRGPAFDASQMGNWPVSSEDIQTHLTELKNDVVLTRAD